jgi:hypothetical protein
VKRVGKLATKDREILAERWKPLVFQ